MVNTVDLKVGFRCNNLCKFCVQGDIKRIEAPSQPLSRLIRSLKEGIASGARRLVLTGGESTIHEKIFEIIREARRLGFNDILMQSNGRTFHREKFCRDLIEAGVDTFAISVHGSTAETHDHLTSRKGSFKQTMRGIENLKRFGQCVVTNTVITTANYRDLPGIAGLLAGLGVGQCQFAFIHINGLAEKNKSWLVARKSVVEPWVKKALDVGISAGMRVMTEAIPYCFMKGYEDCVAEKIIPSTSVFDAHGAVPDYTFVRQNEQKAKGPRCRECAYADVCEGPWREYPEMFGWSEFHPVARGKNANQ